ncbi:hypothetical protein HU751_008380 [Pseudomonas sp. BW13M1]|uniref:Methyltransferase domain-containing protein n=1 Tax=Pseudomonas peradeniyensis TaxID=2745488 RepID=A0A923GD39_9PSED|nr:class I SAM-dependent methyltransferase [Pseudomonas peradeniyensis]MBV4504866.1 hypothetical protein [Pseudomonas peradeniyensis]
MNVIADWRENALQKVVRDPIHLDPRSTDGNLLGYTISDVFREAIRFGQADFDKPYRNLSGIDKARLYALLNQPGHLTELDEAFGQLFSAHSTICDPYVYDIGCGPFTAGLSLATALDQRHVITYHGIDLYESMRELGREIAQCAQDMNALSRYSTFNFYESLDDIEPPIGARINPKIFVASYLLASSTIEVEPLVKSIVNIADTFSRGPSLLLYTNTTHPLAGQKFPAFKEQLEEAGFRCPADDQTHIAHRNKTRSVHYALFYKPASF